MEADMSKRICTTLAIVASPARLSAQPVSPAEAHAIAKDA